MTIKERIYEFISTIKTNNFAFEKKCGFSRGYLNAIKSDIGSTKLEQILRAYPELSPTWLVLGDGPMFKKDIPSEAPQNEEGCENQGTNVTSDAKPALKNSKNSDFDIEEEIRRLRYEVERLKELLNVKDDEIKFYRSTISSALKGSKDERMA